jgi:hypothetical protein
MTVIKNLGRHSIGDCASKILTLWKSPTLINKTGEELQNKRLTRSDKMFVILEKNLALPRRKLPFL